MKTNVYITNRATHHDDGVSCIEKAQSRAETDAIVPKDMRYKQEQASCEIILLKGSRPNDLARHGMHLARLRYTQCNLMATDLTFFLCPCM